MKTVLCFGDSNTYGYPAQPLLAGGLRYAYAQRWTSVVQAELGPEVLIIPEGLNGRTTVHDDPIEGIYKNGARMLPGLLESHAPLDVVVIMLGTNDLKARFGLQASDIAAGVGTLVRMVRDFSHDLGAMKVLVVCPPPVLAVPGCGPAFAGAAAKAPGMAAAYRAMAAQHGVDFLDAGSIIRTSTADGVHFDAEALPLLGKAVAAKLKIMLG